MSVKSRKRVRYPRGHGAAVLFAALGDETRLVLVGRLSHGRASSISQLTKGSRLTRQAITKHLRVLGDAGLVHSTKEGRENLFEFNPAPVDELKAYLERVSADWDAALGRLRKFVEE